MDKGSRTITKADLVEAVHDKVGFSKKESSEVVERVFATMKSTLEGGDKIKVSGFGKFEVRHKHARRGRNPKTEEALVIPEHYVLSFRPSQVLKAAVAGEDVTAAVAAKDALDLEDEQDRGDEVDDEEDLDD